MTEPPGFTRRLLTCLTINLAETAEDFPFPELRVPPFSTPAVHLYENARQATRHLGWEISAQDLQSLEIKAVVTSRIFRFKDDVTVRIESTESGGSRLFVRSASRAGTGDLGANRRHIVEFLNTLRQ